MSAVGRGGFSLIEVVIAIVIVALVSIPLLEAFGTIRTGVVHSRRRTIAVFLGQAILENVRYRLYCFGPHKAGTGAAQEVERQLAVQTFFQGLVEEGAVVAFAKGGEACIYFAGIENLDGTGLHGITPQLYPALYPRLKDFACEVQVILSSSDTDSDKDGEPEPDLCELRVTLRWTREQGKAEGILDLWTMITSRRHSNAQ